MKRTRGTLFLALLVFFLLIFLQCAVAQSDSLSYSSNDSTKTYDGYDTSGYYFDSKQHPDEAFTDEKISVRIASDTAVQRLKNDEDFWYIKSIEDFKKNAARLRTDRKYRDSLSKEGLLPPDEQVFTKESGDAWYLQSWFINTIWFFIISIFIAAVVYFLMLNKISLFSKKAAKRNGEEALDENNLFSLNYDQLLQKYVGEKNYRFAVRILYLQVLQLLSERGIISYQPQFTNAQYLQQLQPSSLYQNFFLVTQHYEYIWYGEFAVNEDAFEIVQTDFLNLKNKALQ